MFNKLRNVIRGSSSYQRQVSRARRMYSKKAGTSKRYPRSRFLEATLGFKPRRR